MIRRLRVQNYKALRDVVVQLTPIHALIGPNDSGKSSVLEAMRALCRSVDYPLDRAFLGEWQGRDLVTDRDGIEPVVLTADCAEGDHSFEYMLLCSFASAGRGVSVFGEQLKRDTDSEWLGLNSGEKGKTGVYADRDNLRNRSPMDLARGPSPSGSVHGQLSGVQYYRWDPRFLSLPTALDSSRQSKMDASGFGLPALLDDMLGRDRKRFAALESRFRELFPHIASLRLLTEKGYRAPGNGTEGALLLEPTDGKGLHFELTSGMVVPASQISDGVLLVLAYLAVLHSAEPPRVLLIEEPENGIHPRRLQDVLNILRELIKGQSHTQVLMTTHSPYVLDFLKPEEVSLCQAGEGGVRITRLADSPAVRRQLDVFSLGEIWTAEGDAALAAGAAPAGNGAGDKRP